MKATATAVSLYWHNRQAIAVVFPDAVITVQKTLFYILTGSFFFFSQFFLFFLSVFNDLFQLIFLGRKVAFFCSYSFLGRLKLFCFLSNIFCSIFNVLLAKFFFQLLHLNFFIDGLKLTVVLYVVTLFFVFGNQFLCIFNPLLLLFNKLIDTIDLFFHPCLTGIKTGNLIFKVFYFHRKFSFQNVDLI